MTDSTKTLCPYCGVGCGLEVTSSKPQMLGVRGQVPAESLDASPVPDSHNLTPNTFKIRGDRSHPSSQGMVCVKGATILESIDRDRLLYPMFRESLDEPFHRITWDEAFTRIIDRIQFLLATQGADAICMYGSGQFVTEDYYVAQKLLKGCLGTNNFDANSRLCMSSAVSGYIQSFGSDGPPCCYEDLELTDCAFLVGTNTAECHPIVFNRLQKHHKRSPDTKLIVVDPRRTQTAEVADLHLAIQPGTDIDLLNGMANLLLRWNYLDKPFIDSHTNGFSEFAEVVRHYPPETVAERCGIPIDDLETAARWWGESDRVLSLWSMGVNQSSEGTAKVCSIINLHLLTGQVGKPGSGPFSLTGQPNAMGGREAGGLSHLLPGYRSVKNPQHRAEVEQFWQLPNGQISAYPGRTTWEMITGLETGDVGMLWIAATNPLVSLPDLGRVRSALRRSPFTIYQEAYHPTETTDFAHLLLPATQWSEKTGTMTNSERRVTLCPAFQPPKGEAREDWAIFAEVGRRLGFPEMFAFTSPAEVHAEFVQLTAGRPCDMSGISHDRLRHDGPLQWPLPAEEGCRAWGVGCEGEESRNSFAHLLPSTLHPLPSIPNTLTSKRLYTDLKFPTPDGRATFVGYHAKGLAEPPDTDYPYILTNGRLYGHWHTQTRTGRVEKTRQMYAHPFIEMHPCDAEALGVKEGEMVQVRSRRGTGHFPALITKAITPGTVFVPMHWGSLWADGAEANAMTHPEACPDSRQPELKACAVQLLPLRS